MMERRLRSRLCWELFSDTAFYTRAGLDCVILGYWGWQDNLT